MKKDRIVGLILFAISVIFTFFIQQFPVLENSNDPGPRLFPYIGSFGLMLCSIGIFFRKSQEGEEDVVSIEALKRILLLIGVLVAFGFALEFIGFLIATPFFLFIFVILFTGGKKSYIKAIVFSIVTSLILYFVFQDLLNIILPTGHFI